MKFRIYYTFLRAVIDSLINQRLSRKSLEEKNLRKFRKLVAFAKKHSPFYSKIIDKNSININNCIPEDFPVLTKHDVMENFDEIVTDKAITKQKIEDFLATSKDPFDLFNNNYYVIHTSGSSGEIGCFVYSRQDWIRGIVRWFMSHGFSLKLRKERVVFFGATKGHFGGVSFASTVSRPIARPFFDLEFCDVNDPLELIVEKLNSFKPDILTCYPSALMVLVEKHKEGTLKINPNVIYCSGEPINLSDRSVIENSFGVPVVNLYSSSEHIWMGIGRAEYNGIYLLEDNLIFELGDKYTCVTNLFNYTMPLIRYRMEDLLRPQDQDDEKIFPFIKVKEVIGRNENAPIFTNKHGVDDFISPSIITEFVVKYLRRFQMQVIDRTSFLFRVCIEDGLSDTQRAETFQEINQKLKNILKEKDLDNVSFEVQEVDDLPVDKKTGKFRLILPPSR